MPTKKKTEPAEAVRTCVNCGKDAAYRTITRAANVDHYCESCGERSYPGLAELERLDAG